MKYKDVRDEMKIGDLIAFSGNGLVSNAIKKVTNSAVSHVGIVFYSYIAGQSLVQVMESTSLGEGFAGVKINRLSDHIRDYDGAVIWYPLSRQARDKFDEVLFCKFLLNMEGRRYDPYQAVMSGIDLIPDTKEDFKRLFCSELVAEAYERAKIVPSLNASEMTPQDVINFNIFDEPGVLKTS